MMAENNHQVPETIEVSKIVGIIYDTNKDTAKLNSTELKRTSLIELLSGTKGRVDNVKYCNSPEIIDKVLSINDTGMITVNEDKLIKDTLFLCLYEPNNTLFATLYSPSGQVAVYQIKSVSKKNEIITV
jgi:hypothetical protein